MDREVEILQGGECRALVANWAPSSGRVSIYRMVVESPDHWIQQTTA